MKEKLGRKSFKRECVSGCKHAYCTNAEGSLWSCILNSIELVGDAGVIIVKRLSGLQSQQTTWVVPRSYAFVPWCESSDGGFLFCQPV